MHEGYKLPIEIVKLSVAKNWDEARLEWQLETIYEEEEPDTCLCGHFPINELCFLKNIKNGTTVLVGNVCVKRFLGLPSDRIFSAVDRVAKDVNRALNEEAIEHAFVKGWITEWEHHFYLNTWRKRSLSFKQEEKRRQINERVLRRIRNARGCQ